MQLVGVTAELVHYSVGGQNWLTTRQGGSELDHYSVRGGSEM